MAIIKAVGGGKDLRRVIAYITKQDKTEQTLIGGWNVDPENAYTEMMETKRRHRKSGGRAYKHFIQSFHADDNVTPQEAHEIAAEFIERCPLFRDFEVVYATHTDRDHVHTHIVCNSVRLQEGRKLSYPKSELQEMKRLSDLVVRAHKLPLEHERPETENVTAWNQRLYRILAAAHDGQVRSWMYDTGIAVQDAVLASRDKETFIREMTSRGYQVNWGKRYVTYTTPDGYTVRASHIEDTFSLPSVRWMYGDRETEQSQLREDLQTAMDEDVGATKGVSASAQPLPVDYDAFDLDLRRPMDWVSGDTIADLRYETACDICRQLRCAATAYDFDHEMAFAGYYIQYDNRSRQYIFHHPSGVTVTSTELEAEFALPSIADALDYLIMRPHVPPGYDGMIHALSQMRTWDAEDLHTQMTNTATPMSKSKTAESTSQGDNTNVQTGSHRTIVLDLYRNPGSPIWDEELRAAAIVYGQALCGDPDAVDSYLAENGYTLRKDNAKMCLHTPRGRRIVITRVDPKTRERQNDTARIGCLAVIDGQYLCDLAKPESDASKQRLVDLAVQAVRGAVTPEDVDAQLIGHGIHVLYHRSAQTGRTERELISKDTSIKLGEMLKEMGIEPQYLEKVPIVGPENLHGFEKGAPEAVSVPTHGKTNVDNMRELLGIVNTAAATAADKPTFEAAMSAAGCGTRWTSNGTLTFILPGDRHIRASQLEKRYKLPPISAAFGVEKRVPKSGVKYEAAKAIRQVISRTTDRDEFDMAMKSAGYTVTWMNNNTDAKITAVNGKTTRLSSLEQTFSLPPVREVLNGRIQYTENDSEQRGVIGSSEVGAAELDGLRNALARAAKSAAAESADGRDCGIEESSQRSENRNPEAEPGTGEGRSVRGSTHSTNQEPGRDRRRTRRHYQGAGQGNRATRRQGVANGQTVPFQTAHGKAENGKSPRKGTRCRKAGPER